MCDCRYRVENVGEAINAVGKMYGQNVVNLSLPGNETVQQLIALENYLQKHAAPEYVLLVYNSTNDYFDMYNSGKSTQIPGLEYDQEEYVRPSIPGLYGRLVQGMANEFYVAENN